MKKKFTILLLVGFIIIACSSTSNSSMINIKQINSNYPIIVRTNRENNKIGAVDFPLVFNVSKNVTKQISILDYPEYKRNSKYVINEYDKYWNTNTHIVFNINNVLMRPKNKIDDTLMSLNNKVKQVVVYIKYYNLSKNDEVQKLCSSYLERAKSMDKDTLHIESIQQLKQTNPNFVNDFLQGDSIRFDFYLKDDQRFYHIDLPVEVK